MSNDVLEFIDDMEEEEDRIIEQNMLRERAKKADEVTDEMWKKVNPEHVSLVEEYLEISSHLSPKSKKQYKSGLRQFFWWVHEVLNDKPLNKISKRDFMRYMSYLQNRGMSSSGMGFKKSAVSAFNIYIENIIAEDDKDNYGMFRNFTRGLQPIPKNQVYDKRAITKEEYKMIVDTLIEDGNHMGAAWVAVAFNTAARRAEIIQLKSEIAKYPIPDGQNYVMSHMVKGKGRSGGKPIEYMINTEALKYIDLWLKNRGYDHEYIFTTKRNDKIEVISDGWANYFCTEVLSDILGRRVNPHIFKASAITTLLQDGVDINLVSKFIAQHNDVSTTSAHYDLRDFEEERNQIFKNL